MSQTTIDSISQLLQLSDCQYRFFDLGRRVEKLTKKQFQLFESTQLPYPYPIQGHALIAITFWQKQSVTPYLWFIKLPLDECGLLNQGARNHFIAIIIEALGSDLSIDPNEKQEELLKSNPYHFTPSQYKLAAINSAISVELKKHASQFYIPALHYMSGKSMSGKNGWHAWHDVGVQGLSDIAFRLTESTNTQLVINAMPFLPEQVLVPFCAALENVKLPAKIIQCIIKRYHTDINENNTSSSLALLRALSASTDHIFTKQYIQTLIAQETLSTDALIIIAGRLWQALDNQPQLTAYLTHLVNNHEENLFKAIFSDLIAIPSIRPLLLKVIRSPKRSPALTKAIGKLFNLSSR